MEQERGFKKHTVLKSQKIGTCIIYVYMYYILYIIYIYIYIYIYTYMCVFVCVRVCVRVCACVQSWPHQGHKESIPTHPPLFCAQKKKLGNKEKIKEFESKNYLKADQSQNITVLVITCSRHLEFKNFPYQATMGAANTFRCS